MKKIAIHDCSYSLIPFLTIRELVNAGVLGAEVAEEDTGVEWLSSYGDHEFIAVAVEAAAGVNLVIKPLPQGRELSLGNSWVVDTCTGQGYANTPVICIDCGSALLASMCDYNGGPSSFSSS